jgi:hypothetical protein
MAFAPTAPYLVLEDPSAHGLQIFRLDADLRGRKAGRCIWGTWAFDGSRLACLAESTDTRQSLLIVDLDSGQSRMVNLELPTVYVMKWLPGTNFIVLSNSWPPVWDDSGSIWLVNLERSEPPRLVTTKAILITAITVQ